ncbi:alpha/beta-hydrolase family protein [Rhodococcus sp. NPDC127528]|uniref:alpha/beta-hydrolase family protein n=1 Tax=unclassified Rhodococcus (in: high G+C Gram-positive bacteria) TaxID=192944 RepID=UPI0036458FDC
MIFDSHTTAFDQALTGRASGLALAAPRVSTTVALTAGAVVSVAPSLLPRGVTTQALLTGGLTALGWGLAVLWRQVSRRHPRPAAGGPARPLAALIGAAVLGGAIVLADRWQNGLRAAMGAPAVGPGHWLAVLAGGAAVCALLVTMGRAVRAAGRRLGLARSVAGLVAVGAAIVFWAGPAAWNGFARLNATANSIVDHALPQPTSPSISGSAASATPWDTLGAEGRRFVSAPVVAGVVRTYVGVDTAPDLDSRVRLAIRELDRTGGLTRSNVVIAVPTGSGWIDANAVAGIEERFGGDVAEVAVQYSTAPSWATFVFDRDGAQESARALYSAVKQRVSLLPPDRRPHVYLYGQSLGSVGAGAALADGDAGAVCGALFAGPPAGTVHTAGATVLANASDPVVRWSPRLLLLPPRLDGARPDAPSPGWLPVVSFVQTTVDLLGALDAPAGHGHRYGTDQGTALPDCAPQSRG